MNNPQGTGSENTQDGPRHRRARREEFALPQPEHAHTPPRIDRRSQGQGANWLNFSDPRVRIGIVAVLALVSVLVLVDAFRGAGEDAATDVAATSNSDDPAEGAAGPVPGSGYGDLPTGQLPPGGPVTENSSGNFRTVGAPGAKVGDGKLFTYTVEVEDTINTAAFGGDDAFASTVDAILSDPRGWTGRGKFAFQHVAAGELPEGKEPDLRIQLASQDHTHEVCGNTFKLETSCFYSDGNRVVINESRWVRGAIPFQGDLGAYRQYVINHEVGHGIGFAAHQPCPKDGQLAPIMMQQTLSVDNRVLREISNEDIYGESDSTCRANPWPYPIAEEQ